jgi:hypothetical protein
MGNVIRMVQERRPLPLTGYVPGVDEEPPWWMRYTYPLAGVALGALALFSYWLLTLP